MNTAWFFFFFGGVIYRFGNWVNGLVWVEWRVAVLLINIEASNL